MIRYLSILLLLAAVNVADACPRCGLFGNKCRFQATYYVPPAPVYYTPPTQQQTFNFVNSFPVAPITGNTVYGYSLASQPLTLDLPLELDRTARLVESLTSSAGNALRGRSDLLNNAMALKVENDRHNNNTAIALAAFQANTSAASPQSYSFRVTTNSGGQIRVEPLTAGITGAACQNGNCVPQQPGSQQPSPIAVDLSLCARCHDGRGTNQTPQGSVIDANTPIDWQRYLKLSARVMAGDMPPNSNLTTEQKVAVVGKLHGLIPASSER